MKTNPIFRLLPALATSFSVLPLQAADPAYPPPFSEVDKDKDGYISARESKAVSGLPVYFMTLDQNSDGKLSPEEYEDLKLLAPDPTDTAILTP
ncbi:EF-hand domain-containing protein [Methylocaldum szegediense]|jgi:hypothetical protein|uniref:EF hand domain-containing protein n=1 Tax=Methylocaldum szegediense TaxID=73780 RepID=A0ABM9HXX5_9GAMM|nr:hypothetical protein [Methylocaldum szegediense]CAI8760287.1 EF hand domain-containing protein [Methylocaldum szegediense]